MKHGYLIDMDGVLYRGKELIAGADYFIQQLREQEHPLSPTDEQQPADPPRRGDEARPVGHRGRRRARLHHAIATARFLANQKPGGTAFVIGEGGLLTALHHNGYSVVDHEPDYVVVGEGRTFNLEQVDAAVRMVLRGAKLIATNLDPNCPVENGLRPGCGAMVAMLETATGLKAFSVGKPSPVMMRDARKELGLRTDETTVIGDTMETDILGAVQLGYHSVLVLSGGTKPEDLRRYAFDPEIVVESLAEYAERLEKTHWRTPWAVRPVASVPVVPISEMALRGEAVGVIRPACRGCASIARLARAEAWKAKSHRRGRGRSGHPCELGLAPIGHELHTY